MSSVSPSAECPICFNSFDLKNFLPKTICPDCNQTICLACCEKVLGPVERVDEDQTTEVTKKEKNQTPSTSDLSSMQQELENIRQTIKSKGLSNDLRLKRQSLESKIEEAKSQMNSSPSPKNPECPFCRKELNPKKLLMNNHLVVQILETQMLLAKSPSFVPSCASCVTVPADNASGYCRSCRKFLCPSHSKFHGEQKETFNHKILTLKELQDDPSQMEAPISYCAVDGHDAFPLDMFCKECEIPICDKCWKFKHRLHEVEEPLMAFERINEESIIPLIEKADEEIEFLENDFQRASNFIKKTNIEEKKISNAITAHFKSLREALDIEEKRALSALSENAKIHTQSYQTHKDELSSTLKKLVSSKKTIETMFRKEHPVPSLSMYQKWAKQIELQLDEEREEVEEQEALKNMELWGLDAEVLIGKGEKEKTKREQNKIEFKKEFHKQVKSAVDIMKIFSDPEAENENKNYPPRDWFEKAWSFTAAQLFAMKLFQSCNQIQQETIGKEFQQLMRPIPTEEKDFSNAKFMFPVVVLISRIIWMKVCHAWDADERKIIDDKFKQFIELCVRNYDTVESKEIENNIGIFLLHFVWVTISNMWKPNDRKFLNQKLEDYFGMFEQESSTSREKNGEMFLEEVFKRFEADESYRDNFQSLLDQFKKKQNEQL